MVLDNWFSNNSYDYCLYFYVDELWERNCRFNITNCFFRCSVYHCSNIYVKRGRYIPIGISIISIAIAIHSIILSKQSKNIAISSDKKMQSLTELNFIEKNAMLESYISDYTGNHPPIKKLIRDLEAAFQVVYWVKSGESEINKNFIDALCRLTNIIITKDLIKNFDETDKKNYMKSLETAEQLKCDEIKLKECKNNL